MNILEAVCSIHIIQQMFCLSPFVINRKKWILKSSKLLEIYSITVIAVSVILVPYGIYFEHSFEDADENVLGKTVDIIQNVGIRIAQIAAISEGLMKKQEEERFYQEVLTIDQMFERSFNVDVNNKKFQRNTIIYGSLLLFVYTAIELFTLIYIILYQEKYFIILWLLYLLPSLICTIKYFQIFASVHILKHRIDLLLTILQQINLKQHNFEMADNKIREDNIKVNSKVQQNIALLEYFAFKKSYCDMEHFQLKKLLIVRDVYQRLFNINEILNCYFGLSLLINVGNNFISITSNFYWIFYNCQDFYLSRNEVLQIINSFAWSLPHLINLTILAILCDRTVKTANKISTVLYGINIDFWNDNHNIVIEQFSLQLLHQKIYITAAGFFNIDCPLLYTIVGSITTYLIILIQFEINETENLILNTEFPPYGV